MAGFYIVTKESLSHRVMFLENFLLLTDDPQKACNKAIQCCLETQDQHFIYTVELNSDTPTCLYLIYRFSEGQLFYHTLYEKEWRLVGKKKEQNTISDESYKLADEELVHLYAQWVVGKES